MKSKLESLCEVIENASLENYNTYKVASKVKYLCFPKNVDSLKVLIAYLKELGVKYFIIGNGSNIILEDEYYDGVFIKLSELNNISIDKESGLVSAEAGVMLPKLVVDTVNNDLAGLEFAAGIPGNIGGSIVGNAGAYNYSVMDFLIDVTVLDEDLNIKVLKKKDIPHGYRTTMFKETKKYIVLACTLQLEKGSKETSLEILKDRQRRRLESQPLEYPSAGSVFRNPENNFAGKLIEDSGLKGQAINGVEVSTKHANFIINVGNGSGKDIAALINKVHNAILNDYGVDLIVEQEFISWE